MGELFFELFVDFGLEFGLDGGLFCEFEEGGIYKIG